MTDGWLNQIVQIDAVGQPVGWHLLGDFVHMTTGSACSCSVYSGVGGYAKAYPPFVTPIDCSLPEKRNRKEWAFAKMYETIRQEAEYFGAFLKNDMPPGFSIDISCLFRYYYIDK